MAIKKFKPASPDKALGKIVGDTEFARLGHLNRLVDDINNNPAGGSTLDAEGNLVIADSSNDTVSVADGASHLVPEFSGMVIVNDHYDGGVETWICGGGDCTRLNYTSAMGGNSTFTQAGNGYEWTNVDNLNGPFTFTVIKTRNSA